MKISTKYSEMLAGFRALAQEEYAGESQLQPLLVQEDV